MAKTKKRPQFNCDVNGGIMVVSALRYALGRMTYVPGAVQDWIKTHWDSLDTNTKFVIVRDVFDYLFDDFRTGGKMVAPFNNYDVKEWEKFGIDRYWALGYDERKSIDLDLGSKSGNAKWLAVWMPRLYENHKHEL